MRNWIETESDGWLSARDVISLFTKQFSEDGRWAVMGETKQGYPSVIKTHPNEGSAKEHLRHLIEYLEGDI